MARSHAVIFFSGELDEHPTHSHTVLDMKEHAMDIVMAALTEMQQHKTVAFKCDFEKEMLHWCKHITDEIKNPGIAAALIEEIQPVVQHIMGPKVKHTNIDKLCRDLYKFKVESSTHNSVVARLVASSSLNYQYAEFLKQMMTDALIKAAMRVVNKSVHDIHGFTEIPPTELDEIEQNVVRYCAGFIMFKFVKYFDSRVGLVAARYGNLIMSFQDDDHPCDQLNEESDTFMEYSKKLIKATNRGGLFVVNNRTFAFFCQLEQIVKPHLSAANINKIKHCSASTLKEHILQTVSIQSSWEVLCRDAPEELDLAWLQEKLVAYWLKLRMKAFGTAYMYARRRMDSKMEEKGAISMRKKLKKN